MDQYPPAIHELRALDIKTHAVPQGSVMWRIHQTASLHTLPWNQIRTWGPLPTARWDPHPLRQGNHAQLGAAYLGRDVPTCLAETFQLTRFVDVDANAPYLTAFLTRQDVVLADFTGEWLLKAGGSAQVIFQEKARTRAWARAIHAAWPDLGGIVAPSAVLGGHDVLAVWSTDAFPSAPELSVPLNSPAILADIAAASAQIGFGSNIVI
ncbi:RES family NAD+ phosphorylase [Arthrobacter sp. H35-D1]|uniref:RES family NAD+ phosphorylase n=1 Tax=Arthrobacter sp. H35-D1 TaxID=3046202 RepID=UPI0024B89880|nr:RES family NAD+ phosphorylase [Arthrobacter sp. H35-D1]MDJ0312690.1 RES family NAD+ phosphorylase [Arthrobacter sp. H35-D1]